VANSSTPVSRRDARVRAQAGLAAAQRYFERYPAAPGADFQAAERDLEMSLRGLAPGDPLHVDSYQRTRDAMRQTLPGPRRT
jgi:hypothetical protein